MNENFLDYIFQVISTQFMVQPVFIESIQCDLSFA